jgi:hypothetical protein
MAPSPVGVTRKVIYVSCARLTDKMARDWYIDYLIARGSCVEYWDVVALVREEHIERGALTPGYLRVFRTFAELEKALDMPDNRDALYMMLLSYGGRFTGVFRLLSKHRCRMLYFAWGAVPGDPGLHWRRIAAWATRPDRLAREIVHRSRAHFLRRTGLVAAFEIVFAAGAVAAAASSHAVRVVPINYFDYDQYVQAKADGRRLVSGRYAVFLDSYLPYHSDLAFAGSPQIEAEPYYRSLNRCFATLEREHALGVVVAAHPRADYDTRRFEGRSIHRLATAELVRDAEFVLSHWSTAMSYAVLNRKPLVFIHTNEMAAAYDRSLMRLLRSFAACLNAPVCNIDAPGAPERLVVGSADPLRYERYKYDYLTSRESESLRTQEILWRELNAL